MFYILCEFFFSWSSGPYGSSAVSGGGSAGASAPGSSGSGAGGIDRRESYDPGSALHVAVQHGAKDVLELLLKFGLDPNDPGCPAGALPRGGALDTENCSSPSNFPFDVLKCLPPIFLAVTEKR